MNERARMMDIEGLQTIDHGHDAPFDAFFLGCVVTPPSYARQDLGPVTRIILLSKEGGLYQDVVRPRYATIVRRSAPAPCRVMPGMKGVSITTQYGFYREPLDKGAFDVACELAGITWVGRASSLWGADSVDVPAMSTPADVARLGTETWGATRPQLKA